MDITTYRVYGRTSHRLDCGITLREPTERTKAVIAAVLTFAAFIIHGLVWPDPIF